MATRRTPRKVYAVTAGAIELDDNPVPLTPEDLAANGFSQQPTSNKDSDGLTPLPAAPGVMRSGADLAVRGVSGALGAGKALADAAGANNVVSRGLGAAADAVQGMGSDYDQALRKRAAERMQRATDSGSLANEIQAALANVAEAPGRNLAEGAGSLALPLGAGLATKLARFGPAGVKATIAMMGAAQGTGAVKGGIYDTTRQELISAGVDEKEATEIALAAQEYLGPNKDQIALGAGIGLASGATGAEGAAGRMLAGGAARGAARSGAGAAARAIGKGAATEAITEGIQEGQEAVAGNLAAQRAGAPVDDIYRGAAGRATHGAVIGAALGGAASGVEHATAPAEPTLPSAADMAGQPEQPGPPGQPGQPTDPVVPGQPPADPTTDPATATVPERPTGVLERAALSAAERRAAAQQMAMANPVTPGPDLPPAATPGAAMAQATALARSAPNAPPADPRQDQQLAAAIDNFRAEMGFPDGALPPAEPITTDPPAQATAAPNAAPSPAPAPQRTRLEIDEDGVIHEVPDDSEPEAAPEAAPPASAGAALAAAARRDKPAAAPVPSTSQTDSAPAATSSRTKNAPSSAPQGAKAPSPGPAVTPPSATRGADTATRTAGAPDTPSGSSTRATTPTPADLPTPGSGSDSPAAQKLHAVGVALRFWVGPGVTGDSAVKRAANGRAQLQGDPTRTAAGRKLLASMDEAIQAGATQQQVDAALLDAAQRAPTRPKQPTLADRPTFPTPDAAHAHARRMRRTSGSSIPTKIVPAPQGEGFILLTRMDPGYDAAQGIDPPPPSATIAATGAPAPANKTPANNDSQGKTSNDTTPDPRTVSPDTAERSQRPADGTEPRQTGPSSRPGQAGADANGRQEPTAAAVTPAPVSQVDRDAKAANRNPTDAQKKAGNYKLGHTRIGKLDISIENPNGSMRSGTDRNGTRWSIRMAAHYGYIRGTNARDGDKVDVFIRPGTPPDYAGPVFIVDQVHTDTRLFDEHKVMLGYPNLEAARRGYYANYSRGWQGLGAITERSMAEFEQWISDGKHNLPIDRKAVRVTPAPTPDAKPSPAPAPKATTTTPRPSLADKRRAAQKGPVERAAPPKPSTPAEIAQPATPAPTVEGLNAQAAALERDRAARARRDAAPDPAEFRLTGSDRDADQAAAAGQNALFEPSAQPAATDRGPDPGLTDDDGRGFVAPTAGPYALPQDQDPYTHVVAQATRRGFSAIPQGEMFGPDGQVLPAAVTKAIQSAVAHAEPAPDTRVPADSPIAPAKPLPPVVMRKVDSMRVGLTEVKTAADAGHFFADLRKSARERFNMLVVDKDGKPLALTRLFIGAHNSITIPIREVVLAAYQTEGAAGIWVAHNHPSGNPSASNADRNLTQILARAFGPDLGIELHGHVIVAGTQVRELRADGTDAAIDPVPIRAATRNQSLPITERLITRRNLPQGPAIQTPDLGLTAAAIHLPDSTGLVLLDGMNRPIGALPMADEVMGQLRTEGRMRQLIRSLGEQSPSRVIVVATNPNTIQNIGSALDAIQVDMLDGLVRPNDGAPFSMAQKNIARSNKGGTFFSRAASGSKSGGKDATPTPRPVDRVMARAKAQAARFANGPDVTVIATIDQAPDHIKAYANEGTDAGAGKVEGFFDPDTGMVYLIADALPTDADIDRVYLHETLGHLGIRAAFGPRLDGVLDDLVKRRPADIARKLREYRAANTPANRRMAAEEIIANLAERDPSATWVQRLIAAIRTGLRKLGLPVGMSDADIIARIITPARRALAGDATPSIRPDTASPLASRADQTSTKAFRDWFKGSKVVDADGNPQVVYHGSPNTFTTFDPDRIGDQGRAEGGGFYFTTSRDTAAGYGKPMAVYLAIQKPLTYDAKPFPRATMAKILRDAADREAKANDADIADGFLSNYGDIRSEGLDRVIREATDLMTNDATALDQLGGLIGSGLPAEIVNRATHAVTGHDGVVSKGFRNEGDGSETIFVAFFPEQIKSATDNSGAFDPSNADIRFSRGPQSDQQESSRKPPANPTPPGGMTPTERQGLASGAAQWLASTLRDATTNGKKFARWRGINTQYHKATLDADFKRVFDATQAYTNDISLYANDAANLAPRLLPNLANFGDIWKKVAQKPESIDKVSSALLDGTLAGESVTDGKVWTDAELRDRGFTDHEIGLYREARKAIDRSLADLAKSEIASLGDRWLSPDAKDGIMAAGRLDDALTIALTDLDIAAEGASQAMAPEIAEIRATIEDRVNRAIDLIRAGYMPLMRFGNYGVWISKPGATPGAEPETLYFSVHDSLSKANAHGREMLEALKAEHPDASLRAGVMTQEEGKLLSGVSPDTLEVFGRGADLQDDPVWAAYIRLVKNNRSAMKRLLARKGTPGYSQDLTRILAAFITSNARAISANIHAREMTQAVEDIPKHKGDVYDDASRLVQYMRDPREEAQALRGAMFQWFLGGSIASAVVNLSQPFTMTYPYLSVREGAVKGAARMTRALKDAATGATLERDLQEAMALGERQGIVEPQQIHALQAEVSRNLGTNLNLRKGLYVWGYLFQAAERFNRRSAFIAAYRQARDLGDPDPYASAIKAVIETQSIYNKANRPRWARGAVGATVFTFKQFSIAYVEFLARLMRTPEGRPAALLALGVLIVLAGVSGVPFMEDAEDLIDTIGQAAGYNLQSAQARQAFLAQVFGEQAAEVMDRGISALPGFPADIQARLGVGNLIPGTAAMLASSKSPAAEIAEVAGPVGGLFEGALGTAKGALAGDARMVANSAMPVALKNAYKAAEMWASGYYRDTRGRNVIAVDGTDTAVKGIGFQPRDVGDAQRKMREIQVTVAVVRAKESEITGRMAQAVVDRDDKALASARQALADWNAKNPDTPIRITSGQIRNRARNISATKAERLIKATPRELRGLAADRLSSS